MMGSGGGSEDPVMMLSPSGVLCPPGAAGGCNGKAGFVYSSDKEEIGESLQLRISAPGIVFSTFLEFHQIPKTYSSSKPHARCWR